MLARAFALAAAAVLLVFGLRFVPGLVPTTPLAIAGLVAGWRRGARWIVALAVVPLPLVFAVQFPQGALAQWGGRYLLCTGFLLIVSAVAVLGDEDWRKPAGQLFVATAVGGLLITAFGVTWRVHRADGMLSDWAALDEATGFVEGETSDGGPIVVWGNSHGAREAGPLALERRWLAALLPDERADLSRALVGADIDIFYYVWLGDAEPPAVAGFDPVSEVGHLDFQNNDVWRYERSVTAES